MLSRRVSLLLALITCAVALPATSAQAASPGVNLRGALGDRALVQRAIDTGAQQVRIFVSWAAFEPNHAGEMPVAPAGPANVVDGTYNAIKQIKDAGRKIMVALTDAPPWANGGQGGVYAPTPDHYDDYASFAQRFVKRAANAGINIDQLEVWNEPDGGEYWKPSPNPGGYTALLKKAYAAIKDPTNGDPTVAVYTGPTAGNNYNWIQSLYDNGAKGSFDGVSVHTDTACLVAAPDEFYRDPASGNRIGFTSFVGYREVRAVMLGNGDDKPISVSEIGWSSTNGGPKSCARGAGNGIKPNGVSESVQAQYLTGGYRCLMNDAYVTTANWFQLEDESTSPNDELGHYGLLDTAAKPKPSLAAFKAIVSQGGGTPGSCGDFDPPSINVVSPQPNQQYVDTLEIKASGNDSGVGLARISVLIDGSNDPISNFGELSNGKVVGLTPWYGSSKLALGAHTITIRALDKNGNTSEQKVVVQKVAAGAIKGSFTPKLTMKSKKVSCRGRTCSILASLSKNGNTAAPAITGKVAVEWQFLNRKKQWRKLSGGLVRANKPIKFTAKLTKKGRWRVRVVYAGVAPWKKASSKFLYFRLK